MVNMHRIAVLLATAALIATPLFAVDPGHAEGAVTIDGNRIPLLYAYAARHQKNQITNRDDDTKFVLTDKPLPDGAQLADIDYNFPEGILGIVFCVDRKGFVSHVVVQHATGTYDGGYFDGEAMKDYHYKSRKLDGGAIGGNVTSKKVTTNTMTFSFDCEFAATPQ
jgi:hypothetical protein